MQFAFQSWELEISQTLFNGNYYSAPNVIDIFWDVHTALSQYICDLLDYRNTNKNTYYRSRLL